MSNTAQLRTSNRISKRKHYDNPPECEELGCFRPLFLAFFFQPPAAVARHKTQSRNMHRPPPPQPGVRRRSGGRRPHHQQAPPPCFVEEELGRSLSPAEVGCSLGSMKAEEEEGRERRRGALAGPAWQEPSGCRRWLP